MAHLYPGDEEPYDQRDENCISSEEGEEEEELHYCEVCDRDFHTEAGLIEHKKEHKLCGIDGCTFSAHPLLVERHINMQHSSGLYHRMKSLSTPEDIEKWLMERKKRYPTKANIELRKAEELEKNQRGEVIKKQNDVIKQKATKVVNPRDRKRPAQKRQKHLLNKTPVQSIETYRGIYQFCGTLNLDENDIEEENTVEEDSETIKSIEPVNCISDEEEPGLSSSENIHKTVQNLSTSLPTLVANYGSDSDDSGPEVVPLKKIKVDDEVENAVTDIETIKTETNAETSDFSTRQLPNVITKQQPHPVIYQKDTQTVSKKDSFKESSHREKTFTRKQPNGRLELLHRLLSRSIQHERNLICQCIKYIVDNNFFD